MLAAVPIAAMLLTLGVLRWRAHFAGMFSWALAAMLAVTAFGMPLAQTLSSSAQGFVYGLFPVVWILLTAIWMYEVTVASGRFDDLRRTFFLISKDPRVLGLLIAFCFGGLLEALSGFGAPVAITAAMLLAIGFGPVRAALVALLANTVPVAFGAVGLPILAAARTAGFDDVLTISPIAGRLTAILSLVVPFLLLIVMDGRRGLRQCWPFGLVLGATFAVSKWIVSATPLYNLTEVVASVASVAVAIAFLKLWHPVGGEEATDRVGQSVVPAIEPTRPSTGGGAAVATMTNTQTTVLASDLTARRITMALVPYLLVIVVFGIAAIPVVRSALVGTDVPLAWPLLQDLNGADGAPASHRTYTLAWASTPGILLALVALATGFIYRMRLGEILKVLGKTALRLRRSALTIGFVVALAYVMGDSGQTLALGLLFASTGALYPFLAPVLGWLGTYVTGSDTSANILFSGLQAGVGEQIGPDSYLGTESMQALLVGSSATGGVVGKMISPQSLTIAATAIGLPGSESALLRRCIGWSVVLLAMLCLLSGLMSTPVLSWLLPA